MQIQTYEEIVRIQPKGLITIPARFRKSYGLVENSLAILKSEAGRITITPARVLPYPVRSYTDKEIQEFIKFDKKESQKLRKKGLL